MNRSSTTLDSINRLRAEEATRPMTDTMARMNHCIVQMRHRIACADDQSKRSGDRTALTGDRARGSSRLLVLRRGSLPPVRASIHPHRPSHTLCEGSRRKDRGDRSPCIGEATARCRRTCRIDGGREASLIECKRSQRASRATIRRPECLAETKRTTTDGIPTWPVGIATRRGASATQRLAGVRLLE